MDKIKLAAEKKRLQSLYDTDNWFGINPLQVIDYIERIEALEKACAVVIRNIDADAVTAGWASDYLKKWLGKEECDKCGSPDIYAKWDGFAFCRICYEDLLADAKATTEPEEGKDG